jgi:hypothetical protein
MPLPARIAAAFPRVVEAACRQTSNESRSYNCIGYAAEYDRQRIRRWWPIPGPRNDYSRPSIQIRPLPSAAESCGEMAIAGPSNVATSP